MFVHLKKQTLTRTFVVAAIYLIGDILISALLQFGYFYRFDPYLNRSSPLSWHLAIVVTILLVLNYLLFTFVHQKYLKKYPVTPLFVFAMGIIATPISVILAVWAYLQYLGNLVQY